ncbi:hypothetical protein FCL40_01085 [Ferrimonas sediminicola]|uniref:Uncharacterized protein n=1 Tax=Ferrimonas sediminicola TaxID=2569538 RepID=A0A4V5NVV5_9GAMM|nr:hypothetical protein [Ferrimonas sediminicola]TKB51181.1 hypothetical protein FCL40_01085 [Ferrimonas sediminicola]
MIEAIIFLIPLVFLYPIVLKNDRGVFFWCGFLLASLILGEFGDWLIDHEPMASYFGSFIMGISLSCSVGLGMSIYRWQSRQY